MRTTFSYATFDDKSMTALVGKQATQRVRIDVPTGEYYADAVTIFGKFSREDRGRRSRARGFNQQLHAKQHEAHGGNYLFVRDRHNVFGVRPRDRESEHARRLYSQAISDSRRRRNCNAPAFAKRLLSVIRGLRFDSKATDIRLDRFGRGADAGKQPAATARGQDAIEIRNLFEK